MRWRIVLPIVGLVLFAGVSYQSLQHERQTSHSQYFSWSSIRLDSDPLNQRHAAVAPCRNAKGDCASWDPASLSVDPGPLAALLILSAFPAFVIGKLFVHALGRYGISEISSFIVVMPMLVAGWYYALGRFADHKTRDKLSQRK
jgi:hypothetical protein